MSEQVKNQAVSFDVWKTLIRSNPEHKPARNQLVADRFGIDPEIMQVALRQTDVLCDRLTDSTGTQFGPVERLEKIADLLKTPLGVKAIQALAIEVQEQFLLYPVVLYEPDLLSTLDAIQEDNPIALTSNTGFFDGVYMREALDQAGILQRTDHHIFSNEVAAAKPSAKIFAQTATLLGLAPEHITHVGDNHTADYKGATAAGMKAVHLADKPVDNTTITATTIQDAHEKGLI